MVCKTMQNRQMLVTFLCTAASLFSLGQSRPAPRLPSVGAAVSGVYRNMFAEAGWLQPTVIIIVIWIMTSLSTVMYQYVTGTLSGSRTGSEENQAGEQLGGSGSNV